MPNRKRYYAELAGTILMWAEDGHGNPPWKAFIQRRPIAAMMPNAEGEMVPVEISATPESFVTRTEKLAMDLAVTTIRQDPKYQDYAHRWEEIEWHECDVPDDEWDARCARFIAGN